MSPIRRLQQGVSLIELLLVAAAISAAMGVIYLFYVPISRADRVQKEASHIQAILTNVQNAFRGKANYEELNQGMGIDDHLFPKELVQPGGVVQNSWGGDVTISSRNAVVRNQTVKGAGVQLSYYDVPSDVCLQLVLQVASAFTEIKVEGTSLEVGLSGVKDEGQLAGLCNSTKTVDIAFLYVRQSASDSLMECLQPPPQQRDRDCPEGQYGAITEIREGVCASQYGSPSWGDWYLSSDSCRPCPTHETRETACPGGEYGRVQQEHTFDCPNQVWGEWTDTADNCQTCPQPQTERRACPNGSPGEVVYERNFNCTEGSWSAWMQTSTTCSALPPTAP